MTVTASSKTRFTSLASLRELNPNELAEIADEMRNNLISTLAESGGHFASSLGVTELTVALHSQFNTPKDLLVWDTGHQGYIHKMLTGRMDKLHSIRQSGGISGFLKRSESEFDTFGAGHAGTSISAATGMAAARSHNRPSSLESVENDDRYVVAIIGDGSLTSGMAFEALNHSGDLDLAKFIVILNDNEWSISKNVGALSWFFSRFITSHFSNIARDTFKGIFDKNSLIYKAFDRAEEATQAFLASPAFLFEAFGYRYIGPVDGHDMPSLVTAISHAKSQKGPVLLHVRTVKGKGYNEAEADPIKWHAVKPGQISLKDEKEKEFKSLPIDTAKSVKLSYSQIFADQLITLAKSDPQVVSITAAMAEGTGLDRFRSEVPEQFYDVGICEQHAVTFAAGLATKPGLKPVCAIYSTFLQRAFDQVLHDVAIQELGVLFVLDRAGVVGNDGETHQGVFDIAFLKIIPNIVILAPKNSSELRQMLIDCLTHPDYINSAGSLRFPIAIRFPRGNTLDLPPCGSLPFGKCEIVTEGKKVLLLAAGNMVATAEEAARELGDTTVVNLRFLKPLDVETIVALLNATAYDVVATLEDGVISGIGLDIAEILLTNGFRGRFKRFGVPDEFVTHATQDEQYEMCGYSRQKIVSSILSMLGTNMG